METRITDNGVVLWDHEMELTSQDGRYYYRRILPLENLSEKVIVYNTVHMYLDMSIDGKRVYALTGDADGAVKTTGFYWNVIPLTQEDAGKEIVFVSHLSLMTMLIPFMLFLAVIIVLTVHEIAVNKFTGQVKINSICVMVIVASVILELAIYRFGKISTPLGSVGFLFYIAVMGIVNVRRSRRLIEQVRENEIYRKLAFTDELTGLANRTAFREDLDKRMAQDKATGAEKILPTVVFMFDLNDLKKCNDKGFVVNVSISAGYAIYEEGVDGGGLYSTMKRADAMMYEKKQEYKRRIGKA